MFETKYYNDTAVMYGACNGWTTLGKVTVDGNAKWGRVDITFVTPRGNADVTVHFKDSEIDLRMGDIARHYFECIEDYEDVIIQTAKEFIN